MTIRIGALAGAMLLLASAGGASAQNDGDDYRFLLVNGSSQTIALFQTGESGGTWSEDWMPQRLLEEGDQVRMQFADSEDACVYWVRVTFADGSRVQDQLDFCELETVLVEDDSVSAFED